MIYKGFLGGEGEIRTLERFYPLHDFRSCALDQAENPLFFKGFIVLLPKQVTRFGDADAGYTIFILVNREGFVNINIYTFRCIICDIFGRTYPPSFQQEATALWLFKDFLSMARRIICGAIAHTTFA